jgi:hypothetical protein
MRKHFGAAAVFLLTTVCLPATAAPAARVQAGFGTIPLQFEINQGQTDPQVKFFSRGAGYGLFLTPQEAVLTFEKPVREKPTRRGHFHRKNGGADAQPEAIRMSLAGANPNPRVSGQDVLPGKVNYFLGNDPKKWRTNVATYRTVRYSSVYKGVDLVYYGDQKQLEYDFIVKPGADPKAIGMKFTGAKWMHVDKNGDLVLGLRGGDITWKVPVVYQEIRGKRRTIAGHYVLGKKRTVSFQIASYDTKKPLVIDPILTYSTFIGGDGVESAEDMALDSSGNIYLGCQASSDFPGSAASTLISTSTSLPGNCIVKLNPTANTILYATYIGHDAQTWLYGITVDKTGCVYMTGYTKITDFPLKNPLQLTNHGGNDIYVAKLNANGNALVFATYLGGTLSDVGHDIAVDGSGNAYITGDTSSKDFPLINPIQATYGGGAQDIFIAKIAADGSSLVYSTYLGGSNLDEAADIAIDSGNRVCIAGHSNSSNFPMYKALFTHAGNSSDRPVAVKLEASGAALVYSTCLGSQSGSGFGIALDFADNVVITGTGPSGVSLFKLNAAGSILIYSKHFGASGDTGLAVAADAAGNTYVTGVVFSSSFPVVHPLQAVKHSGYDAFVSKISSTGDAIIYSTYLGGNDGEIYYADEYGASIAVRGEFAIVSGRTGAEDFPVTTGSKHYDDDIFISFIGPLDLLTFNTDLKADLLFQDSSSNQAKIWNMNGTSLVDQATVSLTPPPGWSIASIGLLNDDGKPDLVLQNNSSNKITLWYMNVATVVGTADVSLIPASGWRAVAVNDFNRDGRPDLVLQNSTSNAVAVWYLNGAVVVSGGYVSTTPPAGWRVVSTGDFNYDGKPDLVLQNSSTRQIALWYLNGLSLMSGSYASTTPLAGWTVRGAGDFNGDGKTDLVLQDSATNKIAFWYMNGATITGSAYTSVVPPAGWKVVGPR